METNFYVKQSRIDTPSGNRWTPVMSHAVYTDHTVTELFLLIVLHFIIFILFIINITYVWKQGLLSKLSMKFNFSDLNGLEII